jgi:hypothetical protein
MSKLLPMLDPFDEIRRLYFTTTRNTIERDLAHALDLLKRMPTDAERQRAAGLMHGLSDLKREWKAQGAPKLAATGAERRGSGRSGRKKPAAR